MLWSDAALFAIAAGEDRNELHGLLMKTAEAHLAVERAFERLVTAEKRRALAEASVRWHPTQAGPTTADDFAVPGDTGVVEAGHLVLALRSPPHSEMWELSLEILIEAYTLCLYA